MIASRKPPIWMVTGPRGMGKSSFCREMAESAQNAGWEVAGILSLVQMEWGLKTGILAEDLRTGISRRLASTVRRSESDLAFGDWYFDRQTLEWGSQVLEHSLPCDLLVVDELGPLELTRQMGWQVAFDVLHRGRYRLALIVIRPELEAAARRIFDFSKIIEIDRTRTTENWVRIYWPKMMEISSDV